jgi:hypothetical protein
MIFNWDEKKVGLKKKGDELAKGFQAVLVFSLVGDIFNLNFSFLPEYHRVFFH